MKACPSVPLRCTKFCTVFEHAQTAAPRTHILAYSNRADWKVQEPFPTLNPEEVAKSEEKYFTRSYISEKICKSLKFWIQEI